ncbi:MAG TPA: Fic family protein [Candidatus Acidoferrum sp.]
MADFDKRERQSKAIRTESFAPLTDPERARQEALNTFEQYDRMTELIDERLASSDRFRLRPNVIQELNRLSIYKLESDAGRWRDTEMEIEHSRHKPPPPLEVPRYIDEMCDYINDNWGAREAVHLSAYVMWRLNWIHPFVDGNGRTTRAVSYYVLCSKMAFRIPGVKTIPEMIAANKSRYYAALEAADDRYSEGRIDVSDMEALLKDYLANQLIEATERTGAVEHRVRGQHLRGRENKLAQTADASPGSGPNLPAIFSFKSGMMFGAVAVVFFMALVLLQMFGHPVPETSKFLVVIILALTGGLSTTFLGGTGIVKGSVPVGDAEQHPLGYAATGGVAVLILLLVLGKILFL